jgi:hypothetical protein
MASASQSLERTYQVLNGRRRGRTGSEVGRKRDQLIERAGRVVTHTVLQFCDVAAQQVKRQYQAFRRSVKFDDQSRLGHDLERKFEERPTR